jgi:hypothetical protein
MSPYDIAWICIALASFNLGPQPKTAPMWLILGCVAVAFGVWRVAWRLSWSLLLSDPAESTRWRAPKSASSHSRGTAEQSHWRHRSRGS